MTSPFRRHAVLGLAMASIATAGHAKGISYDCDSAPGHFSELNLPVESVPFTVIGKVQVNALAQDKVYAPSTKLLVAPATAPGQPLDSYAGLTLVALGIDPKRSKPGASALQMFGFTTKGREDELLPSRALDNTRIAQPFRLTYDGSNVTVSLREDFRIFPLKTDAPMVQIMCSTGEFLYTDLQILSGR